MSDRSQSASAATPLVLLKPKIQSVLLFDAIYIGSIEAIKDIIDNVSTPNQSDEETANNVLKIFHSPNPDLVYTPLTAAVHAYTRSINLYAEEKTRKKRDSYNNHLKVLAKFIKCHSYLQFEKANQSAKEIVQAFRAIFADSTDTQETNEKDVENNTEIFNRPDATGYTPLTATVKAVINAEGLDSERERHFNILVDLINSPYIDLERADQYGNTALTLAANAGATDVKNLLGKKYLSVDTSDKHSLVTSNTLIAASIAGILAGIIVVAAIPTFTFPAACIIIGCSLLLGAALGYHCHYDFFESMLTIKNFIMSQSSVDDQEPSPSISL